MPPKVRQLKAALSKAGFQWRPGKGSHTVWEHPQLSELKVTLSGQDGDDAPHYQIKQVQDALRKLEERRWTR
jgi:predicted RNA binding protein YcfA (HicA-like mRNA interferase family)